MGRAHEVRAASMAKTSAAKSKLYAKYGKEIFMAAKNGSPDPNTNLALKKIIDKAKKDNVTADVIKRAIDKAKGGSQENYTEKRYEGFGPGNTMIIVDCLTDNDNRTISDVKNCFTKTGGKIGVTGCATHMFTYNGLLSLDCMNEEEVMECLIMSDLDADIETDDDLVIVKTTQQDYEKVKDALLATKEIEFIQDFVGFIPMNTVDLDEESKVKFEKMLAMLEELDDVQEVYHNANL
ncbi:MAG: YebC/PmpR family DNA-binding transcriptional regulator [bacterium]